MTNKESRKRTAFFPSANAAYCPPAQNKGSIPSRRSHAHAGAYEGISSALQAKANQPVGAGVPAPYKL